MNGLRALAFDIQGTAVDFFQPVLRMGAAVNAAKGVDIDWRAFSERWRHRYRQTMDEVIAGRRGWIRVDAIYREALDALIEEGGLSARFTAVERDEINAIWTRLEPWPDAIAGLQRLRRRYTLAALSNGGMAAVIAVVKHAGLPFDAIFSAELACSYKPAPIVYQTALGYLGVPADAVMMVACHKYDLRAAKALGMRTAFVARPLEFGSGTAVDVAPDVGFDLNVDSFVALAERLGA